MDKTIITSILIIAGVVSAVMVFQALYPAVQQSSEAMASMERRIGDQMKSQIEIIHAAGDGGSNAYIWVKNTGSTPVKAVDRCDVFFGPEDDFSRLDHKDDGGPTPYWEWSVENDADWNPTATLLVTVTYGSSLSGRYFVKVATPNGVSDEYYFSE